MPINIERTKSGYPIWYEVDVRALPNPKQRGSITNFDCPICGKQGKLWIDDNGFIGCWHCETQGDDLFHNPNNRAKRVRVKEHWPEQPEDEGAKSRRSRSGSRRHGATLAVPTAPAAAPPDPIQQEIFKRNMEACKSIDGTPGMAYLVTHRCLTTAAVEALGAMYTSTWHGFKRDDQRWYEIPCNRVVFPFRNQSGDIIGLNARLFSSDGQPVDDKYKWQNAGGKSRGVIITPGAMEAHSVAICEAALDAASLWMAGLPAYAVGGCDKIPTWLIKQLNAGITHGKTTVWIASDNDAAGKKLKTKQAIQALNLCNVYELKPPEIPGVKDWNDVLVKHGTEALREQVQAVTAPNVSIAKPKRDPAEMKPNEHYQAYGWASIYSHALGRWIIVKRDASVRIPKGLYGQVWTREQINATAGMSKAEVQFIGDVGEAFDGEVLTDDAVDGDLFGNV